MSTSHVEHRRTYIDAAYNEHAHVEGCHGEQKEQEEAIVPSPNAIRQLHTCTSNEQQYIAYMGNEKKRALTDDKPRKKINFATSKVKKF